MELRWVIHYDVAALVFDIILILFISRTRRVRLIQNTVFRAFSYALLIATVLDLGTAFTLSSANMIPVSINKILNICCLLCSQILPMILLVYLQMSLRIYTANSHRHLWLFSIPMIVASGLIISSYSSELVFYFDDNLQYMHGPIWPCIALPSAYIAIVSFGYIIKYRKNLKLIQNIALLSFDIMTGVGMLLQVLVFEWVLLTYFCMTLSLLVIYLALQRHEYYVNKSTDMFNLEAFSDVYEESMRLSRTFKTALLVIPDLQQISSLYKQSVYTELMRKFNELLSNKFGKNNVYMLTPTRFMVYLDKKTQSDVFYIVERIRSGWIIENKLFKLPCTAAILAEKRFMPQTDNLLAFIDVVVHMLSKESEGTVVEMSETAYIKLNRRMDVQRALHTAIDEQKLKVYYQPIFDSKTRTICSMEALARIEDEKLGIVPAAEFIDIAEHDGSITGMTLLLFERACETANKLGERYPALKYISFNLSAAQLLQNSLANNMYAIALKYAVPFTRFAFELTESEPVTGSGQISSEIDTLCKFGACLSLDDFGTGYSNLSSILNISFETVKFDKSLVNNYMLGRGGLLKYLCDLFHEFGVKIIAEGIETLEQADEMTRIGCDMLQGYYFSKPVSEERLFEILKDI